MKPVQIRILQATLAFLLAAFGCGAVLAQAQNFPNRAVKIIVAFSPGGGTDIAARVLREKITALSATVVGDTPEHFEATMRADSERWGKVIREGNIKAD